MGNPGEPAYGDSRTDRIGETEGENLFAGWPFQLIGRGVSDQYPWFTDVGGIHAFLFCCDIPVFVLVRRRGRENDDWDAALPIPEVYDQSHMSKFIEPFRAFAAAPSEFLSVPREAKHPRPGRFRFSGRSGVPCNNDQVRRLALDPAHLLRCSRKVSDEKNIHPE